MNENCSCERTKKRDQEEIKALMNRLSRIEGQIRGIKNMLEKDAYCTDIITQVSAANAALNASIADSISLALPLFNAAFASS